MVANIDKYIQGFIIKANKNCTVAFIYEQNKYFSFLLIFEYFL